MNNDRLVPMKVNEITEAVIGAAIEVHRASGQGCWSQRTSNASVMNSRCRRYLLSWSYLFQSFTKGSNSIVDIALTWWWPAL